VPERARPGFGATSIVTLALPVPDAPALIVIHAALLFAVQAHDGPAVTRIVRFPPVPEMASSVRPSEYVQDEPACKMSTRRSLTAMPPLRVEDVEFAPTRNVTVAPPCPVAAEVSVIQSASGLAFHEHSRLIETLSAPSPPDAPMFNEFEASVTAHCALVGAVTLVDDEELQLARTQSIAAAAVDRASAVSRVTTVDRG